MSLRHRLTGGSDANLAGDNSSQSSRGGAAGITARSYFSKFVPSSLSNTVVARGTYVSSSFAAPAVGEADPLNTTVPVAEGDGTALLQTVKRGHLTVIPLIGVIFANCVGSGYGFEQAVGGAGPLVTLIACNILPWFWSLPTGLAVAELSAALPSNSGSIVWINAMYHPIISFANILLSVAISCLCNASYASLTSEYVLGFIESSIATPEAWKKDIFKVISVVICCFVNIIGVEIVGVATVISTLITLSPFIGIIIGSFIKYKVNWHAIGSVPSDINWPQFISIVTWNYSNIDSVGNIVEEVSKPQTTLVRAMVPVMFLTYIAYFLPVMAGISAAAAQPGYNNGWWVEGYWADVAGYCGGKSLRDFLLFGAIVSGLGYLITGLCYSGRQLAGMGEMDAFPDRVSAFLSALNARFGTPVRGLILHGIVAVVLSLALSFNSLVAINQVLYCIRLSLVYVAAVKLRFQHPTLKRPFSFPAKTSASFAACMFIAFCVSVATAILSAMQSTVVTAVSIGFVVGSLLVSAVYVRFVRPNGFLGCVVYDSTDEEDHTAASACVADGVPRCADAEFVA